MLHFIGCFFYVLFTLICIAITHAVLRKLGKVFFDIDIGKLQDPFSPPS